MRIFVTGYLNTDDMDPEHVDLSHEMGVSEPGYIALAEQIGLEDMTLELVGDDDADDIKRGRKK